MNKKHYYPLHLCHSLQPICKHKAICNRTRGQTSEYHSLYGRRYGMAGYFTPFWTQKTHYNELYETPNMERLAKQGMMFTQAYANSISSPTRCSLITEQTPHVTE